MSLDRLPALKANRNQFIGGSDARIIMGKDESLTKLNDELAKLERYERRAFSKRRRALQLHGPFGLN
jgi:predicted phage-related endonuclease